MNTTRLKRFATEARTNIKQGVILMMRQWGFDADGRVLEEPELLQGGTLFRGEVIGNEDVYHRWCALRQSMETKGLRQVYEETAYTWFNRFIAIKILSKNNLLDPYLDYTAGEGVHTTEIVAQARRGILPPMNDYDQRKAMELAGDYSREPELLTLLISAVCHNTPILANCFGRINDYTELLLPRTILTQGDFLDMLNDDSYISDDDYCQPELIGWLYQFYIAERKDEVFASFKSGKKAAKEDIPAATQIFTPNWIVKYMVQNTIGRIYLDNNDYSSLKDDWKYLVEPAEDNHDTQEHRLTIENPEELTFIDAGCGSGHILVEAFDTLYAIYLNQYASPREACDAIFEHNIVGVDIDTRAKQLAQFALLMKACSYVPEMADCHIMPRVFDMPAPLPMSEMDNLRDSLPHFFLGGNEKVVGETTEAIHLLQQAEELGSVMKFDISDSTRYAIQVALENQSKYADKFPYYAHLKLMMALTDKYAAVVMNPPYMGSGNMNAVLSKYVKDNYSQGKADIFAVFMEVAKSMLSANGKYGMINMQSWMFLSSFEALRTNLLKESCIDSMLHLGPHTFDELSGEVVQNTAFVITNCKPTDETCGTYYRLVAGANCHTKESMFLDPEEIDTEFAEKRQVRFTGINQQNFEKIPGCPIGYWVCEKMLLKIDANNPIGLYAEPRAGLQTSDNNRFLRLWHEVSISKIGFNLSRESALCSDYKWFPHNKGGQDRRWFGNRDYIVNFFHDGEELKYWLEHNPNDPTTKSWSRNLRNYPLYFNEGITWGAVTSKNITVRYSPQGSLFDTSGPMLFSKTDLIYILGLMNSIVLYKYARLFAQGLSIGSGHIAKVPLIINKQDDVLPLVQQNISIAKQDWDAHETSWDFQCNEIVALDTEEKYIDTINGIYEGTGILVDLTAPQLDSLQWRTEIFKQKWEDKFRRLHENEEELNRQFIDIYGLQDELTPDVPLDEVTILQQGEISIMPEGPYCGTLDWHDDVLMKQLISYAIGVWMGRYRLDKPGLHIVHPAPSEEEICTYQYRGEKFEIDADGIISILPDDAPFTDNACKRITDFVSKVFGCEKQVENLNFMEAALGKSVADYMTKDFWKDHSKMYQKRPIYWLFSSKKGAFQCLAYMHRMDEYTLERIRQKYLLPYISHLDEKTSAMQARESLTTAESRQMTKLQNQLDECREYHDRLHQYSQQNITFDLDDGVVRNYALFGDVVAKMK